MPDMLKTFVDMAIDERIREKYPHLRHPACVYAKIVKACQIDEIYEYTVRILDAAMETDNDFPEIPGVRSSIQMAEGDIAVVMLLYGGTNVYVIGRLNA